MEKYLDHQYIEKSRITNLKEVTNSKGEVTQAAEARLVVYQINLANTQGMKNMKYNDLSTIGETIIKSKYN